MIPKIIHYCWFGESEKSALHIKCIESWKKYLPDYEIKEWNESNFDVNTVAYVKQALMQKNMLLYLIMLGYTHFITLVEFTSTWMLK